MSSSHQDSHDPLPYEDADDPLVPKPVKSSMPILFDSRKQFWRNMISLSWRCSTSTVSLSLLVTGLRIFSRMGELSHMEQRGFNSITILLSAFASLGLGSMIGHLGSILRWRLLARKKYKMQDIELLLGMQSPAGSAKLLIAHLREWRLSLTTFIVMLYLFLNIAGRFSVAIFGLTYNLIDDSVEEVPTYVTNWNSSVLVAKNATDFAKVESNPLSYLDLVRAGLATPCGRPEIRFNISEPQTLTKTMLLEFGAGDIFREPTDRNASFILHLPQFSEGLGGVPSHHAVHTSASCTMFRLDGDKYWKDYGNENRTSRDWKDERNEETIAEVLRVLDSRDAWPRQDAEHVTWAAPLVRGANESSVTYVVYHETAWECISRLSETLEQKPHPNPVFDSATLFLLPIVERVGRRRAPVPTEYLDNACGGSPIVCQSFTDLLSRSSPSFGVQTLNFYKNGTGGSAIQKEYYNLYIATLVARNPIAAMDYGISSFTRVWKDGDQFTQHVETTLEVKWGRVGITAGAIVAGQILAITAVLYYCRNVYVPEDSYLTTAELLETVLNKIADLNTMTAEELGGALDKVLEGPVSYGAISGLRGGQPRVAFGCKVDGNFPGFPPFRKPSVSRRRSG